MVVYALEGRRYGLIVEQILDVLDCEAKIHASTARPGILGSAVVQKRVTDFLDIPALVAAEARAL